MRAPVYFTYMTFASTLALAACNRSDGSSSSTSPADLDPATASPSVDEGPLPEDPVDRLIVQSWRNAGVTIAEPTSDAEYLRRVTLDLVGRPPTRDEMSAFASEGAADKRRALVDRLVNSEEWAVYWSEIYTDLLVGQDLGEQRTANPLREWMEAELLRGQGWDDLADAMISAEGPISKTPPSAFIASNLKNGGPQILTGAVSRKFLGVQIECAECHDHPYDEFAREDFWAMASFFARTKVRRNEEYRKAKKKQKQAAKKARAMGMEAPMIEIAKGAKRDFEVFEKPRGEMKIYPKDAEGNQGPEQVRIDPAFLGKPVTLDDRSRREQLSELMIDSPLFARAAVGFVWNRMLGRAMTDRWDDLPLIDEKTPALLDQLADEFVARDFDLRWLHGRIASTEAYQRSSRGAEEGREASEAVFARALIRPLSSSQLFASLLQAMGLESVKSKAFGRTVRQKKKAALKEFAFIFNDDEMGEAEAFSGNVPQALLLFNGGLTNQAVVRRPGNTTDALLEHDGDEARVAFAYRSVFAREPSASEVDAAVEMVNAAGGGASAWEDLLFAMLNTTEFTTNH